MNKKTLAIALTRQMKLLIDSDSEDVDDMEILDYQKIKLEGMDLEDK
ncbi:hypothetical protein [Lachnoanaerobaculum sp. OBRC5-5]|nr:hypothetical protein [Lachnoanaerobaculum sp. OBRC5-5]EJZ70033.1 hypothetical protein HMPREF1135_01682 [Lachnoanaerobaculum sp. OBRC5-5]